jgi:hypothetical protein
MEAADKPSVDARGLAVDLEAEKLTRGTCKLLDHLALDGVRVDVLHEYSGTHAVRFQAGRHVGGSGGMQKDDASRGDSGEQVSSDPMVRILIRGS